MEMVVHIYSLSEWSVELAQELKSYCLSATKSHQDHQDNTPDTNNSDGLFLQQWLDHSIKVSPSTTICRYNYCSSPFLETTAVCGRNTDLYQQKMQRSIRENLQQSIQDWLYERRQRVNSNNNDNNNTDEYRVIVTSHVILEDVISIQILVSATSALMNLYTSNSPPPLHTWYNNHCEDCVRQDNTNRIPSDRNGSDSAIVQNSKQEQHNWRKHQSWPSYPYGVVIVDRICGEAILRGADIYPTNGLLCTDTYIKPHTPVAVYIDMIDTTSSSKKSKNLSRGMTLQEYSTSDNDNRTVVFIGIGIATCTRSEIFTKETLKSPTNRTAAIQMIQIATPSVSYILPPTNNILSKYDDTLVVQNLPSILVAHALLEDVATNNDNEWILDMCCAPGGKTSHVASLLAMQRRRGNKTSVQRIIACDKSHSKIIQVQDTLTKLCCNDVVIPLVLDTTKCVLKNSKSIAMSEIVTAADISKDTGILKINGFPLESFDRILLDPPCSAWGLRPKLSIVQRQAGQLESVMQYQRKFIASAIQLLKPGGIMTYSTCTINTGENETMVQYILEEYPMMEVIPIKAPAIGGPGWRGFGLNDEECHCVRRFQPTDFSIDDSIGFFVAKLRKRNI